MMSRAPGLSRVPVVVARTEFRRTVRVVAGDRTKVLAMAVVGVFLFGPLTLGGIVFLPAVGSRVAAGDVGEIAGVTVADAMAGAFAVAWIFVVLLSTMRAVTTVAGVDQPATLLLSTSVPNAVVGLVGGELLVLATWFLPPTVLLSAAFAYGAGTPLLVAFAVLAVGLLLVTAVAVGFVLGVCVRHLLTVYEPIARYRTPLLVALGVAYFGAIMLGWIDRLTAILFDLLGGSPFGWPGHLLAMGVPNVTPSTPAAIGAVVGTVVLVPVALAAGIAAARVHWFADPARSDDDSEAGETTGHEARGGEATARERTAREGDASAHAEPVQRDTATTGSRLADLLATALDRPVRTVTVTAIRRTKRAPVRLMYVAYPLFGAVGFAQAVLQAGYLPSYLAILFCLYVIWGAGALFTLNPLGDLGRALPAVLTSTLSGREAVRGGIVAGALVAVPVAVLVSVGAGLASPLSPAQTAALLAATVVGAVATPALAAGVGSLFPRFGSVKVTNNREAVMPSKTAFLVYTLAIAVPAAAAVVLYLDGGAGLVASLLSGLLSALPVVDVAVSVPAVVVTAVAWAVLALGLVAPLASYRYATRRFDRFTIE